MAWQETLGGLLIPMNSPEPPQETPGISSVLVALGPHDETGGEEILLMKRTMLVETHKGQISFPGGFREAHDATLLNTALRETHEEIGMEPHHITVLGRLTPVRTRGDVLIYPWVGHCRFPFPFVLSRNEVDRLLFLSVQRLIDEGLRTVRIDVGGFTIESPGIEVDGEMVWGATATMLVELRELLLKAG